MIKNIYAWFNTSLNTDKNDINGLEYVIRKACLRMRNGGTFRPEEFRD